MLAFRFLLKLKLCVPSMCLERDIYKRGPNEPLSVGVVTYQGEVLVKYQCPL